MPLLNWIEGKHQSSKCQTLKQVEKIAQPELTNCVFFSWATLWTYPYLFPTSGSYQTSFCFISCCNDSSRTSTSFRLPDQSNIKSAIAQSLPYSCEATVSGRLSVSLIGKRGLQEEPKVSEKALISILRIRHPRDNARVRTLYPRLSKLVKQLLTLGWFRGWVSDCTPVAVCFALLRHAVESLMYS